MDPVNVTIPVEEDDKMYLCQTMASATLKSGKVIDIDAAGTRLLLRERGGKHYSVNIGDLLQACLDAGLFEDTDE